MGVVAVWPLAPADGNSLHRHTPAPPYALCPLSPGQWPQRAHQPGFDRASISGPKGEWPVPEGAYRWFGASLMCYGGVLPIFCARFAGLGHRPTRGLWRTALVGPLLAAAVPLLSVTLVMFVEPDVFLVLFRHSTATELSKMASISRKSRRFSGALSAGIQYLQHARFTANHREGVPLGITGLSLAANLLCELVRHTSVWRRYGWRG